MDLVIIGDLKLKKYFDEILPRENYFVAKISGKECLFLSDATDLVSSLSAIKDIGASKILEITNEKIDDRRVNIAENMGFTYSGFSIIGEGEYVKPLIKAAVLSSIVPKGNTLTERENEVLGLIGKGMTNKEIAKHLFLSEKTVKNHLNNIFKKIEVTDRTKAALYAVKNNI